MNSGRSTKEITELNKWIDQQKYDSNILIKEALIQYNYNL